MVECQKCGSPVVDGYCCTFCKDPEPDQEEEEE